MCRNIILFLAIVSISISSFIPQMILTTTSDFFNKQLNTNIGPMISKLVNNVTISDIHFDDKVDGVHIKLNLTNIKQQIHTNWHSNVLNVTSSHNFSILSKNINVTLKANIELKVGLTKKQKGQLIIQITQLQANSFHTFIRSPCRKSIGFALEVRDILVDSNKFFIEIKNHKLDNTIINLIKSILKSRVPNMINQKVKPMINTAIAKAVCNGPIQQLLPLGTQKYVVSLNTTDVPYFVDLKILTIPIDLNFQNQVTNATNQQVFNQNLASDHVYENKANCTLSLSSNMLNTILWLIDDSNLLSFVITKDQLGPNPPISLDTEGLSIILPGLRKYPGKDVVIRVNTSSQYSQLVIRSGRILSALSVSVDFIVNNTGKPYELQECLQKGDCVIATQLNITVGLSASVRSRNTNTWAGLIQSIYIYEIQVMKTQIDVKVQNLKTIFNTLISSSRPQINKILQDGVVFNPSSIDQIKKLNITEIMGQKFLDYASFGLVFDL